MRDDREDVSTEELVDEHATSMAATTRQAGTGRVGRPPVLKVSPRFRRPSTPAVFRTIRAMFERGTAQTVSALVLPPHECRPRCIHRRGGSPSAGGPTTP